MIRFFLFLGFCSIGWGCSTRSGFDQNGINLDSGHLGSTIASKEMSNGVILFTIEWEKMKTKTSYGHTFGTIFNPILDPLGSFYVSDEETLKKYSFPKFAAHSNDSNAPSLADLMSERDRCLDFRCFKGSNVFVCENLNSRSYYKFTLSGPDFYESEWTPIDVKSDAIISTDFGSFRFLAMPLADPAGVIHPKD